MSCSPLVTTLVVTMSFMIQRRFADDERDTFHDCGMARVSPGGNGDEDDDDDDGHAADNQDEDEDNNDGGGGDG